MTDKNAPLLKITHPISPEILRELLTYDPDTGKLFWEPRPPELFKTIRQQRAWNTRFARSEAFTTVTPKGHLTGGIFNRKYLAHHVVWAMRYGKWPEYLTHNNGRRDDNRIANLRSVNKSKLLLLNRIDEAIELAVRYGGIDGDHHKAWVIDQMVRALAGDQYEQIIKDACDGEDGPDTYTWEEGIAP